MNITCNKLVSICHPNGFKMRNHTHNHHELVYCLEGNGTADINGMESEFSTGNYYITRKGTVHEEWDESTTRIIYFYFDAPDELVPQGMYKDFDGVVLSTVKKLLRESEEQRPHKDRMTQCLITYILLEADRSSQKNTVRESMRTVVRYVDENIENNIDFSALAAEQHYSFDRFRHIFKEYTGYPPHQYVINARIEKAKFLLKLNPEISLTEVSYNCGFSTSSHFTKAFKSKTGMTPSEYVKARMK